MALSLTSIANYLFKKSQGKSSTNDARQFFEEPIDGRQAVFPAQVWTQADTIPTTAPALADQATSGVVKKYVQLQLSAVPGTTNAFQSTSLKDCIPFNFGDGSYNYALFDSTGASIPFGQGDWIVDPSAGTVTFYGTVPGNMPPKITFFQYIGTKGLAVVTGPATSQAFTEQSSDPAAPASGTDLLYFKANGILYSINSAGVVRQLATLAGTETLTNKTLNSPVINTPTGIVKGDVGLGNVDNTSDATKNSATATLTNKTLTAPVINGGQFDIETFTDQSGNPTTPAAGKTVVFTLNKALMTIDSTGAVKQMATLTGAETLTNKTLTSPVITTPTGIVKGDVGLGNVDNTSDATKNSATATLTNKTLTGPIIDIIKLTDQSSDPSQPPNGTTLLYTKNKRVFLFDSSTAPQSVPLQIATLAGTETLTNKTLTAPAVDVVQHTDLTTSPNQPASGVTSLYSKNGLFYKKSGIDGIETLLGAGSSSGAGGKNYLSTLYDGSNVTNITAFNAAPAVTFNRPDLTYTSSYFTITQAHAMGTGMAVVYTSTGSAATPLVSGSTYYIILLSNGVQLAASLSDALAKKFITITAPGATNTQTLTPVASQTNASYVFGSPNGYPAGSPAGLTAAVNTTTPIRSPNSQRLSVDANNRLLSGWSYDFTMDKADYVPGQLMKFSMTYATSVNYAGDLLVGIEDTTNYYPVQINQAFADPLPATNGGVGRYVGYFYALAGTPTYRLTLAIQTTNASGWTLDINELTITTATGTVPGSFSLPTRYVSAIPTPTMTGGGTGVAKASSPTVDRMLVGRTGDMMRLVYQYAQAAAGTAGTTTADLLWSLPNGQQFDPARVTYQTTVSGANGTTSVWSTQQAIVAGSINDGTSNGTLFIIPYNATQFRIGAHWATNTGASRGILGGSIFNFGSNPLAFSIDVLLPILGYDASATYSTNEIALKQVPTSATSSAKTGTLTGAYMLMTGNALQLQPGMYDLGGTVDFNNNGTSPVYSNVIMGWYAANGADSTTAPAALTTLAGLTILGSTATLAQAVSGAIATVQAPELTIRVTQPVTIYLVPNASATTIANARVTVYALANKRPDYSAFGVYGQAVAAVYGATAAVATAASGPIKYDTKVRDSDSAFSTTTGLFTCPPGKGGLYTFKVTANFSAGTGVVYVNANGVDYAIVCTIGAVNVGYAGSVSVPLTPGQTAGVYTSAAFTCNATASQFGYRNMVSIVREGN